MSHKILIVRDWKGPDRGDWAFLQKRGYQLEFAQMGTDAVCQANESGPDIILMDLRARAGSAAETARTLVSVHGVPLGIVSDLAPARLEDLILHLPRTSFLLERPFPEATLLLRLRESLGGRVEIS